MREKSVKLASGLNLAYRIIGELTKPIILFSNGSIFNYRQFDWKFFPALRSQLDDQYSFLFYDYIGIGRSSRLEGNFDFVRIAEEQIELLDKLGIEQVHLFGYSKGSIINQIMTASSPERVVSFAGYGNPNLANPESFEMTKDEFQARVENLLSIQGIWDQDINEKNFEVVYDTVFIPTIFRDKTKSEFNLIDHIKNWYAKSRLKPLLLGTQVESLYKLYKYYLEDITSEEKLRYEKAIRTIKVPALLMHGTEDEIVPYSSSVLLHEWMPQSKFISFKGYSHSRPILTGRKAKTIMKAYADFLKSQ